MESENNSIDNSESDVEDVVSTSSEHDSNSLGEEGIYSEEIIVPNANSAELAPPQHSYLGTLEEVKGLTYYEHNAVVKLPLVVIYSGLNLVPGQIVPIISNISASTNAIRNALAAEHVFGVTNLYPRFEEGRGIYYQDLVGKIGTTADILEWRNDDDNFKVKCRGSQMFEILKVDRESPNHALYAIVQILPEIRMPYILEGARVQSLNRHRSGNRNLCMRMEAARTRWPLWVYKNYDERTLIENIKDKFSQRFKGMTFMNEASELSFQLLKLLPANPNVAQEALVLKSPIQRLRWINSVITKAGRSVHCTVCDKTLGNQEDVFSMSVAGPHATFVNPQGYIHEILTFIKMTGYSLYDSHRSDFSWFPGYAWCIMNCKRCNSHLGWEFKCESDRVIPVKFWAVKNTSIKTKAIDSSLESESEESEQTVYIH